VLATPGKGETVRKNEGAVLRTPAATAPTATASSRRDRWSCACASLPPAAAHMTMLRAAPRARGGAGQRPAGEALEEESDERAARASAFTATRAAGDAKLMDAMSIAFTLRSGRARLAPSANLTHTPYRAGQPSNLAELWHDMPLGNRRCYVPSEAWSEWGSWDRWPPEGAAKCRRCNVNACAQLLGLRRRATSTLRHAMGSQGTHAREMTLMDWQT